MVRFLFFFNCQSNLSAETCRCPKYLSASKSQSSLDQGGNDSKSIADIIANTVTKSCGYCQEHNETVLLFSNETDEESNLQFPVTRTNSRGSEFSKFISVLEVPGVLAVKRQDNDSSRFYEEIMTGSVFDIWPIFVVSLLTVYSAGVLAWFLVSMSRFYYDIFIYVYILHAVFFIVTKKWGRHLK